MTESFDAAVLENPQTLLMCLLAIKHLHLILCCQVMNHFRVRFYLLETNFVDSPWGILSGPYNIIIVPLELSAHCYTTTGYF